ncbi:MAG: kelch repeat-containing protein [Candidatus Promineifilaceae bacterium]|nr:kelch repeat-containing protein [Candidatus Promineifilaceae bacterium]
MAEVGETLSDRELDVLRCAAEGASNKEIASALSISQNTVKVHLRNIYTKLGVSSRTEATTAGIQHGYIAIPGSESAAVADVENGSKPGDSISIVAGSPAEPISSSPETSQSFNWRLIGLLLLLLLSIVAIVVLGLQLLNQDQATATPEPFSELPIGDSRWLTSRPMLDARADMAVAAVGLDIYQIGGETTSGVDGRVRVFDSVERVWREAADKPTAVTGSSAAELYGEIYVPGGQLANGQPTDVVEAYSPSQNAWRPIAALPRPIAGGLAISDGAYLYLFGGRDDESYLDTAFVYDPSANNWRPLPPMPEAAAFTAGGAISGEIIIAGGQNDQRELDSCYIFEPSLEEWSTCPRMLLPRANAGSAVILNRLYVIGGGQNSENDVSFSEVYDPANETWQVVNTPILKDNPGWPGTGVGQVETRIYALGGRNKDGLMDDTLVYAPLVYQTFIPAASSGAEE